MRKYFNTAILLATFSSHTYAEPIATCPIDCGAPFYQSYLFLIYPKAIDKDMLMEGFSKDYTSLAKSRQTVMFPYNSHDDIQPIINSIDHFKKNGGIAIVSDKANKNNDIDNNYPVVWGTIKAGNDDSELSPLGEYLRTEINQWWGVKKGMRSPE